MQQAICEVFYFVTEIQMIEQGKCKSSHLDYFVPILISFRLATINHMVSTTLTSASVFDFNEFLAWLYSVMWDLREVVMDTRL